MNDQHWRTSRRIVERIVIQGELELLSPAHFGSGDSAGTADLTLLRDGYEGRALLPGASIAGSLRAYWLTRTRGYGAAAEDNDLFGAKRGAKDEMEGDQSLLIVDDALGPPPQIELREGVKINGVTRTAEAKKLFDMEVLRAGTTFPLRFEVLVPEDRDRAALCRDLITALQGLENGDITLGARKRRGLGQCRVSQWRVWGYDLTDSVVSLAWLAEGREGAAWAEWQSAVSEVAGATLAEKLGMAPDSTPDARHRFTLQATFALEGSLLVRSGSGEADSGPDAVHLHRQAYVAPGETAPAPQPVLPGASLAGVLRARALRIANTLAPHDAVAAQNLVDALFGVGPEDALPGVGGERINRASRLIVRESEVDAHTLVQTRIRVDRFTGGAMDNYLFNEAPVYGGEHGRVTVQAELRAPEPYEIGLLLLLLKDLWTGDLPVGGGSGIGRGRLRGIKAALTQTQPGEAPTTWEIAQTDAGLQIKGASQQRLEDFVKDLNRHLAGEVRDGA